MPQKVVMEIPANPMLGDLRKRKRKLRVAAYCRVSTEEEEQQNSFEVQVDYYTEKITHHDGWQLAGIFADATVIIGLKQNPTFGGRFSPIFFVIRAFCGAKRKMLL